MERSMSHHQEGSRQQFQMVSNVGGRLMNVDTTYTKIFVGGLAWETQRDTMRHYFAQFGDIHEAVVITDKFTGKSKGYGFVTFKDPDSAMRACQNPSPVIDGRRANCNLASLGATKTRPPTSFPQQQYNQQQHQQQQYGTGRFRPPPAPVGPSVYHASSSTLFHPPPTGQQYTFPFPANYGYGVGGYSQDTMYPMSYYNMYGGQQYSGYYTSGAAAAAGTTGGIYPNFYPYYGQGGQSHTYGVQYPSFPVLQYPYLPQRYTSPALPPSTMVPLLPNPNTTSDTATVASSTQNASGVTVTTAMVKASTATSETIGVVSEQSSSI